MNMKMNMEGKPATREEKIMYLKVEKKQCISDDSMPVTMKPQTAMKKLFDDPKGFYMKKLRVESAPISRYIV